MIHIRIEPSNPKSAPACGCELAEQDQVIGQRVAYHLVEQGESILLKINADDICPDCLAFVQPNFWEFALQDYTERKTGTVAR